MVTKELSECVNAQLALGKSREEIRRSLLSGGGWSGQDINEVFGKPKKSKVLLLSILIIVAGVVFTGSYIYFQKREPVLLGTADINSSAYKDQSASETFSFQNNVSNTETDLISQSGEIDEPAVVTRPNSATPQAILSTASDKQDSLNRFRAIYSGTATISAGSNNQTISFIGEEDKQNNRLRFAVYKGSVYGADVINKGFIGTIVETTYHFLDRSFSVGCTNIDQFCQVIDNSFAGAFTRAVGARGMEVRALSKLADIYVQGEPKLVEITNGGIKNLMFDTYASGKASSVSSTCDVLNIAFNPSEVKSLSSSSGDVSYNTVDASQSTFNMNICVDRASGLISEYSTDLNIISTEGQHQRIISSGKLLAFTSELASSSAFPFPSKVENVR